MRERDQVSETDRQREIEKVSLATHVDNGVELAAVDAVLEQIAEGGPGIHSHIPLSSTISLRSREECNPDGSDIVAAYKQRQPRGTRAVQRGEVRLRTPLACCRAAAAHRVGIARPLCEPCPSQLKSPINQLN